MAKTNITLYSSTPSSNTDINNINIDENCPASGLNNAIRELMAHLKNVDTGSQALTALSVTGNVSVGGTFTSTGIDDNASSTAMTLDSSGRLLLGTTTAGEGSADDLTIATTGQTGITIRSGTSNAGSIYFSDGTSGTDQYDGYIAYSHSARTMYLYSGINYGLNIDGSNRILTLTDAGTERMRIDSSGNLLVGTTSTGVAGGGSGTSGININANGGIELARSVNPVLFVNRTTSDGDIAQFRKDGTTVGSIGTKNGSLYIGSTTGSDSYFGFYSNAIIPTTNDGSDRDNAIDLGYTGSRFKDLYLSGGAYIGGTGSANYLDDYEEGDFNSSVSTETSGSITIGTNVDRLAYTKVGRMVTITGLLGVASVSSPVGDYITINSLPFTVANLTDIAGASTGSVMFKDNSVTTSDAVTAKGVYMPESTTSIRVYIDASIVVAGDDFFISVTYFTNS